MGERGGESDARRGRHTEPYAPPDVAQGRTPSARTGEFETVGFCEDPLAWLLERSGRAGIVVVSSRGPVLSRAASGPGTVAVFGRGPIRQVLGDLETFGMPVSVTDRHELPPPLGNLNTGLFSLTGDRHRVVQHALSRLLGPSTARDQLAAVDRGIQRFVGSITVGSDVALFDTMRRAARLVAQEVLFGEDDHGLEPSADEIGVEIQRYFHQRRRYAALAGRRTGRERDALIERGRRVDRLLRTRVREVRRLGRAVDGPGRAGVVGELCRWPGHGEPTLTEDEVVGHANVLFMSSTEPVATAATWCLTTLTQLPALRAGIRDELRAHGRSGGSGVQGIVRETLRLAPPSAMLVRRSRRETLIAGVRLPAGSEVIVSPFVEHRRPDVFSDPFRIVPERWLEVCPDSYQFLPFGAGARTCLGRRLALATLERLVAAICARGAPVLARDQWLDWRMDLTLAPTPDPVLRLVPFGDRTAGGPALTGPAAELLSAGTSD